MRKLTIFNPGPGPNSIAGTASTKLLVGSDMDDLTIMLRESVQNSWDARGESKVINYSLTGIELNEDEIASLRNCIGTDTYGSEVVDFIKHDGKYAIQIIDTGTLGLEGDATYDNNHSKLSRFLKFVFEVGNTQQGSGAGGSFGYGKASLYRLSKAGTVGIYTRIRNGLGFEERFIIKSVNRLEDQSDNGSGVFWWGDKIHIPLDDSCSKSILPVIGPEAGFIARSIGMSTLSDKQTGTVLLVYSPYLDVNTESWEFEINGFPTEKNSTYDKLKEAVNKMQQASVHNFWAKYPRNNKGINFEFGLRKPDGSRTVFEKQNPETISPYNKLLECLDNAKKPIDAIQEHENRKVVAVNKPTVDLGVIAWVELTQKDINPRYLHFFDPLKSRIALMRNIEFVVKYLELDLDIPSEADRNIRFIMGVFRTLQNKMVITNPRDSKMMLLEDIYRASENQTHGEWSHNNVLDLGKWCSTYIKQTPRKIIEILKKVYPDVSSDQLDSSVTPDADNMAFLGQFISGAQGGGRPGEVPDPDRNGYGYGDSIPKPKLDYVRLDNIDRKGDTIVSRHIFKLKNPRINRMVRLYPVCPDENGSMTLKESIPVALTGLTVLTVPDNRVERYFNNNGSITLKSDLTELTIAVTTSALTDCRYAVDAEILEPKSN